MPATAADPERELASDRLVLRPVLAEDLPAVERLSNDPDVARGTAAFPYPPPAGTAQAWFEAVQAEREAGESRVWAVLRNADKAFLGVVSLRFALGGREAELGYWIGRPFWRQGFGGEAARCAVDFAFERLRVEAVSAESLADNAPSKRILGRLGMRPVAGAMRGIKRYRLERQAFMTIAAKPRLLVAAVALVDGDGRVLLAQRPPGKSMAGLWEFPGGKVRDDETPEEALIRELKEELDIDVAASCLAPFTFASHGYADFHLLMPLYVCRVWTGTARPVEGQVLSWVRPRQMAEYPMPPADKPLVAMLRDLL